MSKFNVATNGKRILENGKRIIEGKCLISVYIIGINARWYRGRINRAGNGLFWELLLVGPVRFV